ncbi:helix-hairpin-helix domain-containing protein [Flavobacteriaceae bacterium TK19130]|nr:helix-hairpin-helix domain-containing protein [Thermobacterium salinum]
MRNRKSHLEFNRSQRGGIFSLAIVILALLFWYSKVKPSEEMTLDITSPEIVSLQREVDSLKRINLAKSVPKLYPFNPNFITDYRAYVLGLSAEEHDRLLKYRVEGKWINSAVDFKKVTMVSDSLLDRISPYFKFPEWVNKPRQATFTQKNSYVEKSYSEKIDLNVATAEQLQQVYGIGPALSERIVNYRDKLGGFSADMQLHEVYGLRADVIEKVQQQFTVKTPKPIERMNLNTASASDLATIPGISFETAKEIWEFRRLRERVNDLSELSVLATIDQRKLTLFQLYLYAE